MKKKTVINRLSGFIICISASLIPCVSIKAQQVNSHYFIENSPTRHYLNPAFQPKSNLYISLPYFGSSRYGFGNNSFSLSDLVFNNGGQTVSFLHPVFGDKDALYNKIKSPASLRGSMDMDLLGFGFRVKDAYWSFAATQKMDIELGISRDVFKLLLYGTPNEEANYFDFKNMGVNATSYTEFAFGYSKNINEKWSAGVKLKYLYGNANISTDTKRFDLNANMEEWRIDVDGTVNVAVPGTFKTGDGLDSFDYTKPSGGSKWFKPSGAGWGIDLGVNYQVNDHLSVSGALLDLGRIYWKRNVANISYSLNHSYTGAGIFKGNFNNISVEDSLQAIGDELKDKVKTSQTSKNYSTSVSPKLNIAAEYSFLNKKMSVGILSHTVFRKESTYEQFTASVNGKPTDWANISLSGSYMNNRINNIGLGLGIRAGFVHWFVATDYVPLSFARYSVNNGNSFIPIPYKATGFNYSAGLTFVFGNRKDKDRDGVVDKYDICPDTPRNVKVDKSGCPIDCDYDGVPDYRDKCPNTPADAHGMVDINGCLIDSDKDNVPDYLDKCPNTPVGVSVDSLGCPLDADKDGVADYLDKCMNTPQGAKVDSVGCPYDSDKDGIADYLDKCPNTAAEAIGRVDSIGCPLDNDKDGVPDYMDNCPNTLPDQRNYVDKNGCVKDSDGDGVFDYQDRCPLVAGPYSNKGCPEITKEVRSLFKKALQGIQFESGKDLIKPLSYLILNQIAMMLIENPAYFIEVQGHSDNVGNPENNMILSDKRAAAVRLYLVKKGVPEKRIISNGYGDTKPIGDNKTAAGRSLNRRVEFVVSFEEVRSENVKTEN